MTFVFHDSVVEILSLIKVESCKEGLDINELILSMILVEIGTEVLGDWSTKNLVISNLLSDRFIGICVTVFQLGQCICCKLDDEIKRSLTTLLRALQNIRFLIWAKVFFRLIRKLSQ